LPLRVLPLMRFPPLSALPGQMPAQDARCLASGNRRRSLPSWPAGLAPLSWHRIEERDGLLLFLKPLLDLMGDLGDGFIQIVQVAQLLGKQKGLFLVFRRNHLRRESLLDPKQDDAVCLIQLTKSFCPSLLLFTRKLNPSGTFAACELRSPVCLPSRSAILRKRLLPPERGCRDI
jgi:hypothetical protein